MASKTLRRFDTSLFRCSLYKISSRAGLCDFYYNLLSLYLSVRAFNGSLLEPNEADVKSHASVFELCSKIFAAAGGLITWIILFDELALLSIIFFELRFPRARARARTCRLKQYYPRKIATNVIATHQIRYVFIMCFCLSQNFTSTLILQRTNEEFPVITLLRLLFCLDSNLLFFPS